MQRLLPKLPVLQSAVVVLGLAFACAVAQAADRGTAYPAAVETANGEIMLVSGQGDSRQIVRIDPQWLESPVAANDFSHALRGWTVTRDEQSRPLGVALASHPDKPGQEFFKILPTVGRHAAASWNFPSGGEGSLTLRLQIPPGHAGATLSLTDHFTSPADSTALQHSAISLELRPARTKESSVALSTGVWHDLLLSWDSESQVARVVVDDQPEVSIPRRRGFRFGLNYLRIDARSNDEHPGGIWIEQVAASVTALEGTPQSATGTPPQLIQAAPENESVIIRLPDDSLRIFYVARPDGDQLWSITSHDQGVTWDEPQLEFHLPGRAYHAVNVVVDHKDRVHAVFHIEKQGQPNEGYHGRLYNLWHARQDAPGAEWSKPRQFFRGYVGALRGLIALPGGRLLIPFAFAVPDRMSPPEKGEDFGWHDVTVCYSDDGGRNWHQSPSRLRVIQDNTRGVTRYGGVEPHIAREDDGRLWMLIRTKNGVLYESVSTDEGIRWSDPQPTEFISSDSPAWVIQLADGREVLFLNSSQRYDDPQSYAAGGREVLHAAIRTDQTQAWRGFREVLTDVTEQGADRPASPISQFGDAVPRRHVIVVGAGLSGLTAALELGRAAVDVTVLDMSSVFGGHAVMSQGGVTLIDTPVQRESGIDDVPEQAVADFLTWGEDADEAWVDAYVRGSRSEIYDWLTDLGVRFEEVLPAPGNSVDRFHQPLGRGIGLVSPIYRECLKHANIQFVWNAQVIRLRSEHGRIVGVVARHLREDRLLKLPASDVVLATGGFQSNLEMVREFWPQAITFPERVFIGSGRNSVGHGHQLAVAAGGQLTKMDHQWNYFTGIPDPQDPDGHRGLSAANMYGILVNPEGRRFANLHDWAREVMPPLLRQQRATAWWIFDATSKSEFSVSGSDWGSFDKVQRLILDKPELVKQADTIAELATLSGLPPEPLVATIERYNQMVDRGHDEDFGRFGPDRTEYNRRASPKINTPPFYAMQSWPLTRKSMGGVAIDRQCRVLTQDAEPIPGLYAVGELTGVAGINGSAALEGTFLGPCILTGRVAARSILGIPTEIPPDDSAPPAAGTTKRCTDCHQVDTLLANPRNGFWHFEQVHRVVREREWNCLQCHADLAPYVEQNHQTDALALTGTCVRCHVAQE